MVVRIILVLDLIPLNLDTACQDNHRVMAGDRNDQEIFDISVS